MDFDKNMQRLTALRQKVFDAIERQLQHDSHCKSYEGAFEVGFVFPDYFDNGGKPVNHQECFCEIKLHCYVLGPARYYSWKGATFTEALDRCGQTIDQWIAEAEAGDNDG